MSGESWLELRKAVSETAGLLAGAIAGGALGYLLLGDHWMGTWVFPVICAWLVFHAVRRSRRASAADT